MNSYKVRWTQRALSDLEAIYGLLSQESPKSAIKQIGQILNRETQLSNQPNPGQHQNFKNLKSEHRYLVEGNYKLIYQLHQNTVFVDTIFRYPPEHKPVEALIFPSPSFTLQGKFSGISITSFAGFNE